MIEGQHPYLKQGVRILPAYYINREASGFERLVELGVIEPAKDVTVDFGNGTRRKMIVHDQGIFLVIPVMMDQMIKFLASHHAYRVKQKILIYRS